MSKLIALAGLTVAGAMMVASAAGAANYTIRVFNGANATITSFKVKDANLNEVDVKGFKPLPSGKSQTITLSLPGTQCQAYVRTRADNGYYAEGRAAFCIMETGMAIVPSGGTLRYLPWHQYRALGGDPK